MTTYELTPEQYKRFLERIGSEYGAVNDLMAYHGINGAYSRTYFAPGKTEDERVGNAMRAMSQKNGGAGVAEEYTNEFGRRTKVILSTDDPKLIEALERTGAKKQEKLDFDGNIGKLAREMRSQLDPKTFASLQNLNTAQLFEMMAMMKTEKKPEKVK